MRIKEQNSAQIILVNTLGESLKVIGIFFVVLTLISILLVTAVGIIWIVIPVIIAFTFAGWILSQTIIIDIPTQILTILGRRFFLRRYKRDIPLSEVQYVALAKEYGALSKHSNPNDLYQDMLMARYWGNYRNMQDKWVVYIHLDKEELFIDKSTNESAMYDKALNIANFTGKNLVNLVGTK